MTVSDRVAVDNDVKVHSFSLFTTNITRLSGAATNFSGHNIPKDCKEVNFDGYIPWNNPDNIVSAETELLVDRIKSVYVIPLLCVIGVPSNVINMAVFARQGLKDRINLCLFALSFADLVYMLQDTVLFGVRLHPTSSKKDRYGPVYTFMVNHNVLGLYGFVWASQFMSAVIASERCFCILFPLKSKTVLTTKTMAVIIVVAFVVIVGGLFVVTCRFAVVCVYNEEFNVSEKVLWRSEAFKKNEEVITWLEFCVYGVFSGVFILIVIVETVITSVKLKRIVDWRASSSSHASSNREIAITRMLVGTSALFVVCFLPGVVFRVVCLVVKDISLGKRYHNFFLVSLYCLDIASSFNAAFNFIFYYRLGSRYREVLWEMIGFCKRPRNVHSHPSHKIETLEKGTPNLCVSSL